MRSAAAFTLFLSLMAAGATADEIQRITGPEIIEAIGPYVFEGDVRNLPTVPEWQPGQSIKEIPRRHNGKSALLPAPPMAGPGVGEDPLVGFYRDTVAPTDLAFDVPAVNIDGASFSGVQPPDPVLEVGASHVIQMINAGGGALFRIYDKSGALVSGPTALDSLGSGSCASGLGDPIVLWDELAGRWLMSEFAAFGNHLCVYVSQGADPITSGWFAYDFSVPNFPDYPKYGVWHDAYYVGTNESSPAVYALDRDQMLAGLPATAQRFTIPDLGGFGFQMLNPSDVDGPTPPPAGSPNYFMRHNDDEVHGGPSDPTTDKLEIFEYRVDFDTPANSSVTGPIAIEIAEIDSNMCGLFAFSCFEQPGTNTELDPLREPVMFRLAYRNTPTHQKMVGNLVTDASVDHGGVRWFELRNTGVGGWGLFQEGTIAPDGDNRWMGAISTDVAGNIAIGYNVGSSSQFPSIRYSGRLESDPLGTMPQGEHSLVEGGGSNTSNRYGDYSSMSTDPVDGCTFWFTGEYNPSSQWSTRIGAFSFDSCSGGGGFTLQQIVPGSAGTDNTFATSGASANGRVFVIAGSAAGTTDMTIPGCGTVTLDVGGVIRRLGASLADGAGSSSFDRFIPGGASGATLQVQAVDQDSCAVSNVVVETF